MTLRTLLPALAVLGATACGAAPATQAPEPAAPADHADATHGGHAGHGSDPSTLSLWAVQSGPLGVVATDGNGRVLYRSDADSASPPTSNCTGACTATWSPLLLADGQELDLAGVPADRVGRLERPDGTTQVTLAGWPVYTRPDDDGTLRTTGANGADGTWWAVAPTGEKVTAG